MSVPLDLVPLSRWARRVSIDATTLKRLSLRGEFPPIYVIAGRLRVSDHAVREWVGRRRLDRLTEEAEDLADWVRTQRWSD